MLYREIIAACSQIHTEQIRTDDVILISANHNTPVSCTLLIHSLHYINAQRIYKLRKIKQVCCDWPADIQYNTILTQ